MTREHHRGKFLYYYEMEGSKDFIEKMKEYRTLTVFLPFPGGQRFEVRYKLANAVPSIQQTMKACWEGIFPKTIFRRVWGPCGPAAVLAISTAVLSPTNRPAAM